MSESSETRLIFVHFGMNAMLPVMKWLRDHFGLSLGCAKYYTLVRGHAWLPLPDSLSDAQMAADAAALGLEHTIVRVSRTAFAACEAQVERDNRLCMREKEILAQHQYVVQRLAEYVRWEQQECDGGMHAGISAETRKTFDLLVIALDAFNRAEFDRAIPEIRRFLRALDDPNRLPYELDAEAHRQTAAYLLSFALESTGRLEEADTERVLLAQQCRLNGGRRWHLMCRQAMRSLEATSALFVHYRQVTGVSVLNSPPNFEGEISGNRRGGDET